MSIGEFASLRGVSVGTIRYYEKEGLLRPAYVNPETGYRYFRPEQLQTLDAISATVGLGVPLSELRSQVDEDGNLEMRPVLERGIDGLRARIDELETRLAAAEYNLNLLNENDRCQRYTGIYRRDFPARNIVVIPVEGEWESLSGHRKELMSSYRAAFDKGMAPILPFNILIDARGPVRTFSFFFPLARAKKGDPSVVTLPHLPCRCLHLELSFDDDVDAIIREHFPEAEHGVVFICNMLVSEKLSSSAYQSEIYVPTL